MEMFQYDFIQRAFVAGFGISLITPILGLLLILRGQSLMADTLSHVSLAGVALGVYLHRSPTLATLVVVLAASLAIEYLRVVYRNYSDISIAMMMSAGMALALILMNSNRNSANFKIDQYLFGSILLVTRSQVELILVLAVLVVLAYWIFRRPLYVMSFDEDTAHTSGLPVQWMSIIFSVVTGVAISIMMPIVGALLVSALIVIPAATAIKLARSFTQTIVIGVVINWVGIASGLAASFHLDTPPGAAITLAFIGIFALVSLVDYLRLKVGKPKVNHFQGE